MNNYVDFRELNQSQNNTVHQSILQKNGNHNNTQFKDVPRMNQTSGTFLSRNMELYNNNKMQSFNTDVLRQFNINSKHQLERHNSNLPKNMEPGMKKQEINERLSKFQMQKNVCSGNPFLKNTLYFDFKSESTRNKYEE